MGYNNYSDLGCATTSVVLNLHYFKRDSYISVICQASRYAGEGRKADADTHLAAARSQETATGISGYTKDKRTAAKPFFLCPKGYYFSSVRRGSKPTTKFHTLEKVVLERDKNTNMKRQNRYILYIISFMAVLSLVLAGMRLVHPERIGNGRSGEQTESKLKGQSGETDQNTRVVLMTSGYGSVLHSSVSLAADSGLRLKYDGQEEDWTGGVLTLLADDVRLKNGHLSAEPLNPDEEIRVESIERGRGIPSYQGKIEVWSGEEGMTVINELPMESYLCRVVPSEMPASYEMEALKAQAVCARSYAVRQMQDYAYPEYQAHVNDSVEYQVYNNSYPADTATQAVKDTTGQVVWYQGNVASTYYFSTSCGETTDMTAWGGEVNESNAYLQSISVCGDVGDYEKDLPWYQWTAEISSERMAALLSNYAGKDLGTLESVEVTRRGDGDVAAELTAVGTGGSITVETENKIRTALGGSGYSIVRNDGQTVDSQKLLPSAFISIEKKENSYVIRGGGYGHGIGMSQNGANEMAKNGKNYMEILKLFYQNVEIR